MSEGERRREVERIVLRERKHRDPVVLAAMIGDLQKGVNRLGVFCLAGTPENILMWSHYSNGHTGFCLEFRHEDEPFLGRALPLTYAEEYPSAVYLWDSPDEEALE
jgi:DUF2971 family protein